MNGIGAPSWDAVMARATRLAAREREKLVHNDRRESLKQAPIWNTESLGDN